MANTVVLLDSHNHIVNTFTTIQAAVNAAAGSNHDTISVGAGTYQEQVLIDGSQVQNLTIVGAGQGATKILSPDAGNLVENFTTAQNSHENHNQDPLIGVENGANVTIEDLTIDGNNQGVVYATGANGGGDLVGIEALNSSVTVSDVHVTGVEDVESGTLQGGQGNKAIVIDDEDSSTQTFTMTDSTVDNFQKDGVLMEGTGLTVDVNNDSVTGVGADPTNISQNLIELAFGATGSIENDTVTGISDADFGSIGVLVFQSGSGVTVSDDIVTGLSGNMNSSGIYFADADAAVAEGNTISDQGFALTEDGADVGAFSTALLQDNNIYSGNLFNYSFYADPLSTTSWSVGGSGGTDDLEGGTGNDVFLLTGGSAAGSVFIGHEGIDTVQGYGAGYSVAIQGGQWVVTNGTLTDTLTGIEKVVINGQTFDLVDSLGPNAGGFQTVAAAASAAGPGDIIVENTSGSTVVTVDHVPDTAGIANQTAYEQEAFNFTLPVGTFTDGDSDTLTYTATLANGDPLPAWLTFDPATETFSGTPANSDVATLSVKVTATDPSDASASATFTLDATDNLTFIGAPGNDTFAGHHGNDIFKMQAGGTDTVSGNEGNDSFYFDVTLTAADTIDGGAGSDKVVLGGDYTGGNALVFGATTMVNVETLVLRAGFSYDLTTNDSNVAAGETLVVNGGRLGATDSLTFNGAAESDGHFLISAGAGNDALIGGSQSDTFNLSQGGSDSAHGGGGNDTFMMGAAFTATDSIDGGTGHDTVKLDGNYTGGNAVVFFATTMVNVEDLLLRAGSYNLTTDDATVASGQTLRVQGLALGAGDSLTFDGSAETNGHFNISGGAGNDHLTGGALHDTIAAGDGTNTIKGGGGADSLTGGSGVDTFVYSAASDSTGASYDTVHGFDASADFFDTTVTVGAIDTTVAAGRLSTVNFDANLTAAIGAGQLGSHDAVLFTPTIGNLAGHTFLVVDINGAAGYQAGQDLVIELSAAQNMGSFSTADFT